MSTWWQCGTVLMCRANFCTLPRSLFFAFTHFPAETAFYHCRPTTISFVSHFCIFYHCLGKGFRNTDPPCFALILALVWFYEVPHLPLLICKISVSQGLLLPVSYFWEAGYCSIALLYQSLSIIKIVIIYSSVTYFLCTY